MACDWVIIGYSDLCELFFLCIFYVDLSTYPDLEDRSCSVI